jgi:predicted RNase H-like HicB family nuclease
MRCHRVPRASWICYNQEKLVLMTGLDQYKIVLYRQEDGSWVAEIPAISGCYALMPTREQALEELNDVFKMIAEEYQEKVLALPADTTEIVHA